MKSKSLLLFVFLLFGSVLHAQNTISVKSFRALPMDRAASSLEGKRVDQNGQVAALIKVVTPETGFFFEGGSLGVVDTKQRIGEIWVWVPRGLRKITVLHQQLGVLRDYVFPVEIEAESTYEMVLTTAKIETVVKEQVREQYLMFQITPPDAILEVDDEVWKVNSDGTAMKYVHFGTYDYRVRASDYLTDAGKVTVDDPDNTKVVNITLAPNFATLTLVVDSDAEIWVNNEKKGVRKWTGPMGNGTYKIECKQAGHETSMVTKDVGREMDGQTINLPVPKPIYGSLMVESTPLMATIFIDGKEVGVTPKSINELLIGEHEIKLSKDGYSDFTETIFIEKSERKQVKATLNAGVPNAQLEIDGQLKGNEISQIENNETPTKKRSIDWEEVAVTTDPQDVQNMVFLTEVIGTSTWCNAAGPTIGYNNAVKEIKKKAAEKGCCMALITDKSFFMKTRVTARLYLCK